MEQLKHILLVDDSRTILKHAEIVLKDEYRISTANSGKEAIAFLRETKPDLVLLDVNMPEMDGYETLQRIRTIPGCDELPIVFLSAETDVKTEIKVLGMGAMDFIRKPLEPQLVTSRLNKIFTIEETKRNLTLTACQDVLTGLWNRQYLEEAVEKQGKCSGTGVFLLMDLDNFKAVNDTLGHIVGDAVLMRFSETLKELTGDNAVICRLGGDEFVVFLKDGTKEEYWNLAQKLLKLVPLRVAEVTGADGSENTVSIGISCMPHDGSDFLTLYNKADKALYHVKQNGKHSFHIYHEKEKDSYTF